MGWVEDLQGTIGVDTSPFIYLIEEHPVYLDAVRSFFEKMDAGEISGVTSTVTLLEVLVQPFRRGAAHLAGQYREVLLNATHLSCVAVTGEIAEKAASLRTDYNLRTPDAIHLATAIQSGATAFLTNDSFLTSSPNLDILILDQLVLR
jgi:predicted nucleic acid-binding protein